MKTAALEPVPPDKTLIRRSVRRPVDQQFINDLVLFTVALSDRAEWLVQGLDAESADRAQEDVRHWRRVAASERHAALAHRFGPCRESASRLQRVLESASLDLKRAVAAHVPAYLRHVLEGLELGGASGKGAPPLRDSLAARLVREANQPKPSRAPAGESRKPDEPGERRK